ncbi:hypothetical protein Tco_1232010, partial [Tanacetum coccineum]
PDLKGSSKRILKSLAVQKQLTKLNATNVHKPEPRHTKDFEAKYNKVKAKLALLSSSASAPRSSSGKNKGLIPETYDWDEEEVSSEDNEVTKVKVLMALADEERVFVGKESAKIVNELRSLRKRNTTDPLVAVTESSATNYDSVVESLVCSTHLPPLKKLDGVELVSRPKTIKSILKSKSTFKAETLEGIIINEPSSAPARGNKSSSASKTNSAPAGKLKNVKIEDDPPLAIVMKELNELKLQISKKQSSYFRNKNSQQVPPNALQNKYKTQFKMNCELCRQNNHLSENCYEVLFCKKCKRTEWIYTKEDGCPKRLIRARRPFEILERIDLVAYRLRLPEGLNGVHDTFHVSNLKKYLADASLHVPLDEIKVDKTLCFIEEPVEILNREVKSLKRSKIVLVKVRWNSKCGPEFTWEREDYMKSKYPRLFVDRADTLAS